MKKNRLGSRSCDGLLFLLPDRRSGERNDMEYKLGLTEQWEKARKPLKILGKTGVMR